MSRASDSRAIISGVVPEATSEWNPEIAPHAMVIKAKGKSLPANTGPSPAVANGVSAGIRSGGRNTRNATPGTPEGGGVKEVERECRGAKRIHTGKTEAMKPYPIIIHVSAVALWVNSGPRCGWPATQPPATRAASSRTAPTAEASPTFPGRHRFIHHPISSAMGIVHAMVNRPHGDA